MIEVITTCEKCGDVLKSPPAHVGDSNYWLSNPSRPKGWVYYHIDSHDSMGEVVSGTSVLACRKCSDEFLQTFKDWKPAKSKEGEVK